MVYVEHTFDLGQDSGVAFLHSFEFREKETAFHVVEQEDPKCLIAA